ncbi:CCA tRNA nucleotidyltransferase [Roseovarius sp. D22-M7]|uniref:CCA tRNA nucleotidyltransferase n=1 Tax=Roseovarius sp. D22-M7 TaxID=3127116 RepID=UPI0030101D98
MRLSGDWIAAPATQAVCAALTGAGYRAVFVGGCVRNALMGRPVSDIDMATDAPPDAVMRLADDAGLKPVPTGIDHGTVTVVSDGKPHEVTTFREDVDTFGRHAEVAFGSDLEADARRRDFTMNALYADPDGTVIDPLGGIDDLRARRVRFIGDAGTRIREDYLRILRFFRFHAQYGDAESGLDPDALAACAANLNGLDGLSRERIGAEMRKLLSAPDPAPAMAAMQAAGVLARILPGADAQALGPLVHLEARSHTEPDATRRLAALGGADAATRLRLSRAETKALARLQEAAGSDMRAAELGYRLGSQEGRDALLVRAARSGEPLDYDALMQVARGAKAQFPVKAADLKPDHAGPALGQRLRELESRWIASGFTLTREDLL